MSEITRLELIRQIRDRYRQDREDLSDRERIMYGDGCILQSGSETGEAAAWEQEGQPVKTGTFSVRLFLAAVLAGCVILADANGLTIGSLDSGKLFSLLAADYQEKLETWVETFSVTVFR